MTGVYSGEAECSKGVATVPHDCGNVPKVANVRRIVVALPSEIVHEAKNVPPSRSLPELPCPRSLWHSWTLLNHWKRFEEEEEALETL